MAVQWLGPLEPRQSQLSQILSAIQPAASEISEWLAEKPERERAMVNDFLQAYSQAPPEFRQRMESGPNFGRMLELVDRYHPGMVITDEAGYPSLALSRESLQGDISLRLDEHALRQENLVSAIQSYTVAPEEQRELLVEQHQDVWRQAAQENPTWFFTDPISGLVRPVDNVDSLLERELAAEEAETLRHSRGLADSTLEHTKQMDWLSHSLEELRVGIEKMLADEEVTAGQFHRYITNILTDHQVDMDRQKLALEYLVTNENIELAKRAQNLSEWVARQDVDIRTQALVLDETFRAAELSLAERELMFKAIHEQWQRDFGDKAQQLDFASFEESIRQFDRKMDLEELEAQRRWDESNYYMDLAEREMQLKERAQDLNEALAEDDLQKAEAIAADMTMDAFKTALFIVDNLHPADMNGNRHVVYYDDQGRSRSSVMTSENLVDSLLTYTAYFAGEGFDEDMATALLGALGLESGIDLDGVLIKDEGVMPFWRYASENMSPDMILNPLGGVLVLNDEYNRDVKGVDSFIPPDEEVSPLVRGLRTATGSTYKLIELAYHSLRGTSPFDSDDEEVDE